MEQVRAVMKAGVSSRGRAAIEVTQSSSPKGKFEKKNTDTQRRRKMRLVHFLKARKVTTPTPVTRMLEGVANITFSALSHSPE
jgi:hypothetical protein